MSELNTKSLSAERQADVLNRLKIEFRGKCSSNCNFIGRRIFEIRFRKLLKSKTLMEFLQERRRLDEEGIYYGTLEELLTEPFIGLSKKELYTMGLDNERVDALYKLNYEELFFITSLIGKDEYEKIHSYRDTIRQAEKSSKKE